MVELDDKTYEKLLKDSNDNRSILRICRIIIIALVCIILLAPFVYKYIDISLDTYRAEVRNSVEILEAQTKVRVRNIESEGLTTDQYLKWLEVTNP